MAISASVFIVMRFFTLSPLPSQGRGHKSRYSYAPQNSCSLVLVRKHNRRPPAAILRESAAREFLSPRLRCERASMPDTDEKNPLHLFFRSTPATATPRAELI